jgi:hypothetical protein
VDKRDLLIIHWGNMIRTRWATALLAAVTITVAGSATPALSAPSDEYGKLISRENALLPFQNAVDKGEALHVGMDSASGKIKIMIGQGQNPAGNLKALMDSAVDGKVVVTRAAVTAERLQDARTTLRKRAWRPDAQRYVYGFYFDETLGQVRVTTNAPAEVMQPLLTEFGDAISVDFTKDIGGRLVGRLDDVAPHIGGAGIRNISINPQGLCTAGPTVKTSNGTRYMVTAGHCGDPTDTFYSHSGNHFFGTMTHKRPFPARDMAMFRGSTYRYHVYYGGTSSNHGWPVSGAANPGTGGAYCTSGRVTGEVCGRAVFSLNAEYCDPPGTPGGGCTQNLISFGGGGAYLEPGDSGGPFYAQNTANQTVAIRGMNVARTGTILYAEQWAMIASQFGVTVATS